VVSENETAIGWSRSGLAQRAADDVPDGAYVNLGIGIPMMIPARVAEDREVWFHTENGILGLGGVPEPDDIDLDVTNAGKEYARIEVGASIFDSSLSFAIVRGGHLDIAVLGGMEATPSGDLANWTAPGRTPGVGGAMDLVMGAKQVCRHGPHRQARPLEADAALHPAAHRLPLRDAHLHGPRRLPTRRFALRVPRARPWGGC